MEYKILNESLVYYACKNSETGRYKAVRCYSSETTPVLNNQVKLYRSAKTAEYYGKIYNCPELVKVKLVEIE